MLPELFIPIAEDTNNIAELTYSVLSQAVRDTRDLPQNTFLSLNLSPRQFADPWLSQKILAILSEAGFPPQRIEIEITETAVVQRLEEAKATLKSLPNLGVRIALDDFGTGYSGLHHLRELSLDTLKIDRPFIMQMLAQASASGRQRAVARAGQEFLFGRPEPTAAPGAMCAAAQPTRHSA